MTHDSAPAAERPDTESTALATSREPVRPKGPEVRSRRGKNPPHASIPGEDRYHMLLRNLRMIGGHGDAPRTIGVTRLPGCGNTSVVATNLAWTLAKTVSQPVLLVGASPTNRVIDDTFRGRERRKITSLYAILREELPLADAVFPTTNEHLFVLPTGSAAVTPDDLASLRRFTNLLEDMRHNYEYVVFDLPPADSLNSCYDIAVSLDGVVLEIEAERVRTKGAEIVTSELRALGVTILGAILKEM